MVVEKTKINYYLMLSVFWSKDVTCNAFGLDLDTLSLTLALIIYANI